MSEPVMVPLKEKDKVVTRFAVFFRNDLKVPGKVVKIDMNEKRIVYELLGGPDKGKRFSSRFDESQTAFVYDKDNLSLALLET